MRGPPMKFPNATASFPTGTVAVTVLVAVLITETLLPLWFAAYTSVPAGFTAIPHRVRLNVHEMAVTTLVLVLNTDTVLSSEFVT